MFLLVIFVATVIQFAANLLIARELLKRVKDPLACAFWLITCLMITTLLYTKFVFMMLMR